MIKKQFPNIDIDYIDITQVLKSLSDPIRLKIVLTLAQTGTELSCSRFESLGKKSNLSQHYKNLRQNGLISIRREGLHSYLNLRCEDLNRKFPKLIDTIVKIQAND
ncbi:helix-turn-helix transcriptional regulator [Oenococcus sp. UCMA 16435]|nr:helix-turn-helix transcriptional regulator [Oenococcus sp. UCMA 16435]MDI4585254.1 helix-turn-helix domain-containing protein [Oenococcus sp. UCMA 14587]